MSIWQQLDNILEGSIHWDTLHQKLYATDASVYRKLPSAVAYPKSNQDLVELVKFCQRHEVNLIPRGAGTSLAGQVVGTGLIVDTSKHLNKIIEINPEEKWVRCQPGVVRDELNQALEPYGLIFGPNTSTSNRCVIGGMVGNNSCGTTSIYYGSTRDKIRSILTVLSDGSMFEFGSEDSQSTTSLISEDIFSQLQVWQKDEHIQSLIKTKYPKKEVTRRNSGYALDALFDSSLNDLSSGAAKLLCGSEGTLALTAEVTLNLDELPPEKGVLVGLEFDALRPAMESVQYLMALSPYQCELIDDTILNCTKDHPTFGRYLEVFLTIPRAFIMVEFRAGDQESLDKKVGQIREWSKESNAVKRLNVFSDKKADDLWKLRKAGLGLLANLPGEARAVACIEDTAVALADLPDYIEDFEKLMLQFDQKPVYYAHIGAGELHLRPVLNLKTDRDKKRFEEISKASAELVVRYGGSVSGEHGDGRVRAPFLELMYGKEICDIFQELKSTWDPKGIFNAGKIVNPLPMTEDLRVDENQGSSEISTVLRYPVEGDILKAAEKCNGSGDCRKSHHMEGTMCPSFHLTKEEKDSTRGRANVLREVLSQSKENFDDEALGAAMDLCLSCKACSGECPSKVDMASMKSNWLNKHYQNRKRPWRDYLFMSAGKNAKWIAGQNILLRALNSRWGRGVKSSLGLHPNRPLPFMETTKFPTDLVWDGSREIDVLIYADEFIRSWDMSLLHKCHELVGLLGKRVAVSKPLQSGRSEISKGFLEDAKSQIEGQVNYLVSAVKSGATILGLEPSTILTFKDEAPRLVDHEMVADIEILGSAVSTFAEWWASVQDTNGLNSDIFLKKPQTVYVHGHCHFKALCEEDSLYMSLSTLPAVSVNKIPSGCCGMAGSFGYEKEHYDASVGIANLTLLPTIEKIEADSLIVANGTSCRHQIKDLSKRNALHPVDFIHQRLKQ